MYFFSLFTYLTHTDALGIADTISTILLFYGEQEMAAEAEAHQKIGVEMPKAA